MTADPMQEAIAARLAQVVEQAGRLLDLTLRYPVPLSDVVHRRACEADHALCEALKVVDPTRFE